MAAPAGTGIVPHFGKLSSMDLLPLETRRLLICHGRDFQRLREAHGAEGLDIEATGIVERAGDRKRKDS